MTAPRGQLDMTVEVMSILPGVYLVDFDKVTGDSVDFYNSYAKITELVQPLITADALRRADSGQKTSLGGCGHVQHDSFRIRQLSLLWKPTVLHTLPQMAALHMAHRIDTSRH